MLALLTMLTASGCRANPDAPTAIPPESIAPTQTTEYTSPVISCPTETTTVPSTETFPETTTPPTTEPASDSTEILVAETVHYILNINSRKFHDPSCKDVSRMKEDNKLDYEGTRDELIAQDYSPCGHCHP